MTAPGFVPVDVDAHWVIGPVSDWTDVILRARSSGEPRRIRLRVRPALPQAVVGGNLLVTLRDLDSDAPATRVVALITSPGLATLAHALPPGRYVASAPWIERSSATRVGVGDEGAVCEVERGSLGLLRILRKAGPSRTRHEGDIWRGLAIAKGRIPTASIDDDELYFQGIEAVAKNSDDAAVALLFDVPAGSELELVVVGYRDGQPRVKSAVTVLPDQTANLYLKP